MKKSKNSSTLEESILLLQEKGESAPISIGEILHILSEKGQSLIILFLSLPFCQPFQIPGLSTPFGLAIAFLGLKMAFGKYAWLPRGILEKSVTPHALLKVMKKILWLLKVTKGWIYPRLLWMCHYPCAQTINGLLVFILGLLLALPLPTPFSNLMVAWSVSFIGLGLLKNDGIFILIGYFCSLFTFGYFIAIFLLIKFIF